MVHFATLESIISHLIEACMHDPVTLLRLAGVSKLLRDNIFEACQNFPFDIIKKDEPWGSREYAELSIAYYLSDREEKNVILRWWEGIYSDSWGVYETCVNVSYTKPKNSLNSVYIGGLDDYTTSGEIVLSLPECSFLVLRSGVHEKVISVEFLGKEALRYIYHNYTDVTWVIIDVRKEEMIFHSQELLSDESPWHDDLAGGILSSSIPYSTVCRRKKVHPC